MGGLKTYGSYGSRSGCGSRTLVKVIKKSENSRNQSFSYYFFLMMEGSGAGSVLVTNDLDADPGGRNTYGSYGFGFTTLQSRKDR
jgi:hypothetical protein